MALDKETKELLQQMKLKNKMYVFDTLTPAEKHKLEREGHIQPEVRGGETRYYILTDTMGRKTRTARHIEKERETQEMYEMAELIRQQRETIDRLKEANERLNKKLKRLQNFVDKN